MAKIAKIGGVKETYIKKMCGDTAWSVTYKTFGSLGTGNKWAYGAQAANGYIYCSPYDSTSILKINPADDTTSTFGTITGSAKYTYAVLADNGKIYCMPSTTNTVLIIDPSDDSYTTMSVGGNGWGSPDKDDGGFIYAPSYSNANHLKIDTSDNSYSTIDDSQTHTLAGWRFYSTNGKMYAIPSTTTDGIVLDTSDDSQVSVSGFSAGTTKNIGVGMSRDNVVYGAPFSADYGQWFDQSDNSHGEIDVSTWWTSAGWQGVETFGDGRAAPTPRAAEYILLFENRDKSVSAISVGGGTGNKWIGCASTSDGDVYYTPFASTTVLRLYDQYQYQTNSSFIKRVTRS